MLVCLLHTHALKLSALLLIRDGQVGVAVDGGINVKLFGYWYADAAYFSIEGRASHRRTDSGNYYQSDAKLRRQLDLLGYSKVNSYDYNFGYRSNCDDYTVRAQMTRTLSV